jgi:hypothetical protein
MITTHAIIRQSRRRHRLALSLAAALVAPFGHTAFAQSALRGYGPSSGRYRITGTMKQSQVQMGQTMEFELSSNQLLNVVVTKSGTALALSLTVDSATAATTAPMPAPDLSAIIGANVVGAMGFDGHMPTTTVTDKAGKPMDASTNNSLKSFFPRLKVGATPGTTWSDTTATKGLQNGANVSSTTITEYTLVGDTTVAGTRGWKIVGTMSGSIEGAGNQGGADFSMKGAITGKSTMVIGAGGVFVSGVLSNDLKMTIDVPMASMQIPMTQTTTTTISRAP